MADRRPRLHKLPQRRSLAPFQSALRKCDARPGAVTCHAPAGRLPLEGRAAAAGTGAGGRSSQAGS